MGYANHIRRLLAFIIDVIILWAFSSFLLLLTRRFDNSREFAITINMFLFFVFFLYGALFESSKWQATPGKRIAGLKVTTLTGDKISTGKAFLRAFGKIVDAITYGVGFAMVLWTKKRQGLHDKIASTLLVSADTDYSFFENLGDVKIDRFIDGKMAELKNLHNSGILNDEEYELAVRKLNLS